MSLIYTKEWEDELMELAALDVWTVENNGAKIIELIEMGNQTKDKKVVQAIIKAFDFDINIDETFYGVLSTIEPILYFESLFQIAPEFLQNKNGRLLILSVLEQTNGNKYTKKEWDIFYDIANKYLNKKDLKSYILAFKEKDEEYGECRDEYPYPQFYQLFQKLLKEKVKSNG